MENNGQYTTVVMKKETFRELLILKNEYSSKLGRRVTWDEFFLHLIKEYKKLHDKNE